MKNTPRLLFAFWLLLIFLVALRFSAYEPMERSVANYDTEQFVGSSGLSFFTPRFFTSDRPATIALVYKILGPMDSYQLTNLSSPGDFLNPPLAVQPGYDKVASLQNLLSVTAWLILAVVLFRNLRYPLARVLGPALVLLFGFAPQATEWNYVLMSEPISISLFVLLLVLSLELAAQLAARKPVSVWLWAGWLANLIFWVFARDTNTYFLPVLLVPIVLALFLRERSGFAPHKQLLLALAAGLLALFFVQSHTAQLSGRWINPFFNNLLGHVFPVPEHLAFFEERGLPATEEVLALRDSPFTQLKFFDIPELLTWTRAHGSSTYVAFIATHPVWALHTFWQGTQASFAENMQPFFTRNADVTEAWFVYLGNLMHPKDVSVLAVVLIELGLLVYFALRRKDARLSAMMLCLAVFFVGEIAMLFVSILGDAAGIVRHTIGSLIPLRLSIWLLLVFVMDAALLPAAKPRRR